MKARSVVVVVLVAQLLSAVAAFGQESTAPHEIQMTARKYQFEPDVIMVKKGERVRLLITATDHDHGIKIDAFNVEQLLKKGQTTTVEFTADKSGEFPFHCSHVCGMGHRRMKGKLVVQE